MAQAAINAKYASWGGPTGVLGAAITALQTDPKTNVSNINYANGAIFYSATTNAHAMYGDIYKKWVAAGGVPFFGFPVTDEASTPDNACRFNNFSDGCAIYWSAATGSHLIYGDIYRKWLASGGEATFGFPITNEESTDDKLCRFNNLSNGGAIYWSAATGAHLIYETSTRSGLLQAERLPSDFPSLMKHLGTIICATLSTSAMVVHFIGLQPPELIGFTERYISSGLRLEEKRRGSTLSQTRPFSP
jgi:uncharacterized protein with LGFP repeats